MKLHLLLVGKTTNRSLNTLIEEYCTRLSHYSSFSVEIIPEIRSTRSLSFEQQKEREGELILKQLQNGDHLVVLDEGGKEYRSVEFANRIERLQHIGARRIVFLIGGPYGFSSAVYQRANEQLSLSRMTFSHQMIRLLFVEQLYRGFTILKGEPYHHE